MTTPTPPSASAEKAIREALPVVAYLVTNLSSGEPSICFEDERGDYGDEDHMPVFDELVLKSDAEAQLAELRAEVERLTAALRETRRVLEAENSKGAFSAIKDTIWRGPAETLFDYIDAALASDGKEGAL